MSADPRASGGPHPHAALTRRDALAGSATLAGLTALGTLSPPLAAGSADRNQQGIAALLAAALTIERSAVRAYRRFIADGVVDRSTGRTLERLATADREHVRWLRATLQTMYSQPPPPPAAADILGLLEAQNQTSALNLAITLEGRALAAYLAFVRPVSHQAILRKTAGVIATHAEQLVALRQLAGLPSVPQAFENGTTA